MGEKKEWLKSEVFELLELYYNKPVLWDVKDKVYRDRVKKRDALVEMAKKFATSTDEISRKLHNLRNQFNSELKKTKKKKRGTGTDESHISKWPYFKALLFLQGLLSRSTQGNISLGEVSQEDDEDDVEAISSEHAPNNMSETRTQEKRNMPPVKKMKIENVKQNDLLRQKALRTLSEDEDQYEIFGKYIASEMRSLGSEYLRKKMKRSILKIIMEINDEEDTNVYSNPFSVVSVSDQSNFSSASQRSK